MNPIDYLHNPTNAKEEAPLSPEEQLKANAEEVADRIGSKLTEAKIPFERTRELVLTSTWMSHWQIEVFVDRKGHKYRGTPTGQLRIVLRDFRNRDVKFPAFSEISDEELDALVSLIAPLVLERLKLHGAHGDYMEHMRRLSLKPRRFRYLVQDSQGQFIEEEVVRAYDLPQSLAVAKKALSLKGIHIVELGPVTDTTSGKDIFITTQVVRGIRMCFRFIVQNAKGMTIADESIYAGDYDTAKALLEKKLAPRGIGVLSGGKLEESRLDADNVLVTQIIGAIAQPVQRPIPPGATFVKTHIKRKFVTKIVRRSKKKKAKKRSPNPLSLVGGKVYVVSAIHPYIMDTVSAMLSDEGREAAEKLGGYQRFEHNDAKGGYFRTQYEFPTRKRAETFFQWADRRYPSATVQMFEESA